MMQMGVLANACDDVCDLIEKETKQSPKTAPERKQHDKADSRKAMCLEPAAVPNASQATAAAGAKPPG